jgi:phosphoglycolate phosphatase
MTSTRADFVAAFDLDGTLVDTPGAIVETFTAVFAATSVPAPAAPAIRATIGMPLERAFAGLLGVPPDDGAVADAVRRYQAHFREHILPRARALVFPGVAEGLAALRGDGMVLAVATSKVTPSAEALLAAAGLRHLFHHVIGADQVTRPKPDPEMGHLVLRRSGLAAGDAVMVGDTVHDIAMAGAAGMRSIAVTYGVHGLAELLPAAPTAVADLFADVVTSVRALRRKSIVPLQESAP